MVAVSFVVTVFNKAPFLAAVVRSLEGQTGIDDPEFIFVDDGSTDGSGAVLQAALDGAPHLKARAAIITQVNQGPAVATNRGMSAATRPWIKLLDGDDLLLPGATLALVDAAMEKSAKVAVGEAVLYGADQKPSIDEPGTATGLVSTRPVSVVDDPFRELVRGLHFNPSTTLIRTDFAQAIGGCDQRVFVQDYSLMLRAAGSGARFVRILRPVAALPESAAGRVSGNQTQILHDLNAALGWFLVDHPETPPALAWLMARRATGRAWRWLKRHHGGSVLSDEFASYLTSKARLGRPLPVIRASCAAFRRFSDIRVPDTAP